MLQVYIWGAGYYAQQVIDEINHSKVKILGILDNDKEKQTIGVLSDIPIISPQKIIGEKFDFLIISVKKYHAIEEECKKLGIEDKKVITYWKEEHDVFWKRADKVEKLIKEKKCFLYRLDSAPYEWEIKLTPQILGSAVLLKKIIQDKSSLCRFGDGEFEMIRGNKRPWFQKPDIDLSKRLKEILHAKEEFVNIAIPQNFTKFDQYSEDAADTIREYMYGDTRDCIIELLEEGRTYYDAYVSRPYIMYKNKNNADEIFPLFKEIWRNREIVIIEGEYSRIGINNDLMDSARSISRILCPAENAWDKYREILSTIFRKVSKKSLICISLGPCATVLAYDLAKAGYQALDIGQLDNEYEWYIRSVKKRISIPGKMVAEIEGEQNFKLTNAIAYQNQILEKIV